MGNPTQDPRRILVIDDNHAIHDDFRKILVPSGQMSADPVEALFLGEHRPQVQVAEYDLVSAFQGEEGVEQVERSMAERRPFDVAFVDMRMPPGLDGVETIEQLWRVDPGLQVVICSAYSDYSWLEIIERLGQDDRLLILKKPFDSAEVAQLAGALSAKRRAYAKLAERSDRLKEAVEEKVRELKSAWEEAETLLGAISLSLIGLDAEGRIYRWNDAAESQFGVASDQAMGRRLLELPIQWRRPRDVERLLQNQSGALETAFEGADEEQRIVSLTVCAIEGGQGLVILAQDVSRQRHLELVLAENRKLEAIGQLSAGVAHEINTPMQYLGDNLEYIAHKFSKLTEYCQNVSSVLEGMAASAPEPHAELARAMPPQQVAKLLQSVPEALGDAQLGVQQVTRIVRGLKEFAHPDSETRSKVDINHILETTVTVTRNEWKYVADVQWELSSDLPLIDGCAGELNQVLVNLVVNAAHSIGDQNNHGADGKGRITMRTRHSPEWLEIDIEDDGGGIPEEVASRIFEPFFTTKPIGVGTGQGLAFARRTIEERHGGKILFRTEPGKGTCFCVQLPLAPLEPLDGCGESSPSMSCDPMAEETPDIQLVDAIGEQS